MRLADFLEREMETVLTEWDRFAVSAAPPGPRMDAKALRDHAPHILRAIVLDLRTAQSAGQQDRKAKGRAPVLANAPHTAAQTHALLRAQSGFNIVQMAGEYRALRASVLWLWGEEALPQSDTAWADALEDMTRFNEAIDQALVESVDFFNREVERARDLFLGVLGHDLRDPLATIRTTANLLGKLRADPVVSQAAARLMRSGARMQEMLDDLLDYNRSTLGVGLSIAVEDTDLGKLCAAQIDDFRSDHTDRVIELETHGNLQGLWDSGRMQQLLSNLLANAIAHGAPDSPVGVRLEGTPSEVILTVHNRGPAIAPAELPYLFDPLQRGARSEGSATTNTHLGLGLFIAREVARAHGGEIEVSSDERETLFSVHLPRAS